MKSVQFGQTPLWVVGAGHGPTALYTVLAGAFGQGRGGVRFPGRRRLAELLGVSVRTVSRWLTALRKIGAIRTLQRRQAKAGTWSTNLFWLAWSKPFKEPSGGVFSQVKPRATGGALTRPSNPSTSLRSGPPEADCEDVSYSEVQEVPVSSDGSGGGVEMKISTVRGEGTLFEVDQVAVVKGSGKTGRKKTVSESKKRGTPTSRIVGWWIGHRVVAPTPGMTMAMGKAVKECLTRGGVEADEESVKRQLEDLMMGGTDSPVHLLRAFAIFPGKKPDAKDYEKNPLWTRWQRRSLWNPGGNTGSPTGASSTATDGISDPPPASQKIPTHGCSGVPDRNVPPTGHPSTPRSPDSSTDLPTSSPSVPETRVSSGDSPVDGSGDGSYPGATPTRSIRSLMGDVAQSMRMELRKGYIPGTDIRVE